MMRDYMILFQDYYDANELFNYLLEHALFIGGELGNPDCWFVPPEFISQYWFLCPNYLPTRLDNSVQVAVVFAQKMIEHLKRRKEMYIMRDKHMEEFPQPTASDLDPSRIQDKIPDHLKGNASFGKHHFNSVSLAHLISRSLGASSYQSRCTQNHFTQCIHRVKFSV